MEHALKAVQTDNRVRRWRAEPGSQWELLYRCSRGQVDWNKPDGERPPPPPRPTPPCPAPCNKLRACVLCDNGDVLAGRAEMTLMDNDNTHMCVALCKDSASVVL